jgi:Glycosyl hydrolase-like 10
MTRRKSILASLMAIAFTISLFSHWVVAHPAQAQALDECQLPAAAINQKATLLQATLTGDVTAQKTYGALLTQHGQRLVQCRNQSQLQTQGVWLRLYPCDTKPGVLEAVLDRIVDRGYNQIYVDTFSNGQVLLPSGANPTPWPSVVQAPGYEQTDLLAQVIQKGHDRGLKVYAWMFALNFGYTYAMRPDRQKVLARNGQGETSLTVGTKVSQDTSVDLTVQDEIFADPYNAQAQSDYLQLVQTVLRRRPDGVLFDYIRYPKGLGAASVASKVKDLWIYGEASQQALYQRAQNQKGLELIRRYVAQGTVTANDVAAVNKLYPTEKEPLWQGRSPGSAAKGVTAIQADLWNLVVAHAMQGPIDFLTAAATPVQQQGIAVGAAFFPEANQAIGRGFDSRLQAWDRFPASIEWHPMAYGLCGDTSCINAQVQKVLSQATAGTIVAPVLTGQWQQATERPSLEAQMWALRSLSPPIRSVSHFSFGWQERQLERDRQFCRL